VGNLAVPDIINRSRSDSINSRKEPGCAADIRVVFFAKLHVEQALFRANAGKERRYEKSKKHDAYARAKSESPAQRGQQQAEIAGVANDSIDAGCHECMAGLDRHEAAEPAKSPITPSAGITQRLARSSRTPELRFPSANIATVAMAKVTITTAIRAGFEKKGAPPQPRTASPRYAAVLTTTRANLAARPTVRLYRASGW